MASFVKLNGFVEHLAEGVHNLGTNQLVVALSNTAPGSETPDPSVATADCILANVTEISYTNLSSRNITTSASAQSGGTYKLTLTDLVLTASGSVGPFRYIYIYNSAGTGVTNPLIGYYDYLAAVTLANGETFTINFDDANGVLTIA